MKETNIMYPSHEKDVYGWALHTVQLLKDKKMNEVDFDGIVEELEEMVGNNENQLINRLSLVLTHLLKWQFQPTMRSHSWIYTLEEQRKRIKILLKQNPSLKSRLNDNLFDAYDIAISKAAGETSLDKKAFPMECPYTFDQIMDDTFYPQES